MTTFAVWFADCSCQEMSGYGHVDWRVRLLDANSIEELKEEHEDLDPWFECGTPAYQVLDAIPVEAIADRLNAIASNEDPEHLPTEIRCELWFLNEAQKLLPLVE